MDRTERTFTSDVREIRRMSAWWREWAASAGLAADACDRGEVCLNEIVGNVLQHGGRPTSIAISLEPRPDSVEMTIVDDGEPFDPTAHPAAELPRALAATEPGGLGLSIVRAYADRQTYSRIQDRNVLMLQFMRRP